MSLLTIILEEVQNEPIKKKLGGVGMEINMGRMELQAYKLHINVFQEGNFFSSSREEIFVTKEHITLLLSTKLGRL